MDTRLRMQTHGWMLIAALSCAPLWAQADQAARQETGIAVEIAREWAVLPVIDAKPRFERVEVKPGERQQFQVASTSAWVGTTEALPYTKPHGTATWSIEPAGGGVTVNAEGMVAASTRARPGKYVLTAKMGSQLSKNEVVVYDPQAVPLKGNWTQRTALSCDGREVLPATPLRELIFRADGFFSATWFPFETRKDYWGTYTYDVRSQKLVLRPERTQDLPSDVRSEGKALIDEAGRLVFSGIDFGTPTHGPSPRRGEASPSCGSTFVRVQ